MYLDLKISVDEKKAKQLVAFLKQLDFVEVQPGAKTKSAVKKKPDFSWFGACPDWDKDAAELRALSNRKKAQW
jgi:hypothetical protein